MTITTVNITGTVTPPNDVDVRGTIRFALSGYDLDSATAIVAPPVVSGPINTDGTFSVPVWPPSRGLNNRTYTVTAEFAEAYPGAGPNVIIIASDVTFPDGAASYSLGSILIGLPAFTPETLSRADWASELSGASTIYDSVAAGLAAVTDGDYFVVISGAESYIEIWRRVSGNAVPVRLGVL